MPLNRREQRAEDIATYLNANLPLSMDEARRHTDGLLPLFDRLTNYIAADGLIRGAGETELWHGADSQAAKNMRDLADFIRSEGDRHRTNERK